MASLSSSDLVHPLLDFIQSSRETLTLGNLGSLVAPPELYFCMVIVFGNSEAGDVD